MIQKALDWDAAEKKRQEQLNGMKKLLNVMQKKYGLEKKEYETCGSDHAQ